MCSACRLALVFAVVSNGQQRQPEYTFGTTVVSTTSFEGAIYNLPEGTEWLPKLNPKKSVGKIYTTALNVTPRPFESGFPGVTSRFEWFAIDYNARVWIEAEGRYHFRLLSDDGAIFSVNGKTLIDNDGHHPPESRTGSAELTRGVHKFRVTYFQGPRTLVALVLDVAMPGSNDYALFDTNKFLPPADPAKWIDGKIRAVKKYERPFGR
ncbi:MAG: beta-glucosidase [Acidobacteria bacterium]|nr:beta-glucosidase [Acidobacteriota bacterium]